MFLADSLHACLLSVEKQKATLTVAFYAKSAIRYFDGATRLGDTNRRFP